MKSQPLTALAVFAVSLVLYQLLREPGNFFCAHVRVAYALVHDHSFKIDGIRSATVVNGVHYSVAVEEVVNGFSLHPPLPGILSVPFVLLGITNQTTISILFGAVTVALAYLLTNSLWIAAFFAFGTPFGYEVSGGRSWGMCLTLSCLFTVTALLLRKRGGILQGLAAGAAALCRYDLALVWPIHWMLAKRRRINLVAGMECALIAYLLLNLFRFGTIFDHSIATWYARDPFRFHVGDHGPFSIHYAAYNLYTTLFMAPQFDPRWIARPSFAGQALILTSPALVLALRPSLFTGEALLLWLAVLLGMGGAMFVWANGFEQFGCRYWIQVMPFLILLMSECPVDQMAKILIVASIAVTTVGTLQMRGVI
jgi:hypothetical protein